jgi:hypothetical protein
MSSYRDPALRGAVYPSEEETDAAGAGLESASGAVGHTPASPARSGHPGRGPAPITGPLPPVDTAARSIVSRHRDGSVEVVTDFDGDGIADVVQLDLDGDGVPDLTYIDSDRDGQLDTVLRTPDH